VVVATIGEQWNVNDYITSPITKVEVAGDYAWADDEALKQSHLHERDQDPFLAAEQQLQKLTPKESGSRYDKLKRSGAALGGVAASSLFARSRSKEKNERQNRNKKLLLGGVALLGAGLLTYLLIRGLLPGEGHQAIKKPNLPTPDVDLTPEAPKPPRPDTSQEQARRVVGMSLRNNGNIWNSVHNYLANHGYDHSSVSVDEVKDAVLRRQGITETQAYHLPVGYHFTIPREVLEYIPKSK
jgi:hypothetical protein